MPSRPPHPCVHAGCAELVSQGSYCVAHKTQHEQSYKQDASKAESKRFYDSVLWKKVRAQVLREEPYCRECTAQNVVRLATVVDHVQRIRAGGSKTDRANLASLCEECHNRKRWFESQGK